MCRTENEDHSVSIMFGIHSFCSCCCFIWRVCKLCLTVQDQDSGLVFILECSMARQDPRCSWIENTLLKRQETCSQIYRAWICSWASPLYVHLTSMSCDKCSQDFPIFHHSSASMYYTEHKPKNKNGIGLGRRLHISIHPSVDTHIHTYIRKHRHPSIHPYTNTYILRWVKAYPTFDFWSIFALPFVIWAGIVDQVHALT